MTDQLPVSIPPKLKATYDFNQSGERQFFFLSDYWRWGGTVAFTAHLLKKLGINKINMMGNENSRRTIGNFGYGLMYQLVPPSYMDLTYMPLITDFFRYFYVLEKLKRNDISIVIHDPTEINSVNAAYLKFWKIICIRKAFQKFLKQRYEVDSKFLYHPFYPYDKKNMNGKNLRAGVHKRNKEIERTRTVSISRIEYGKNVEILMEANNILRKERCDSTIKLYGPFNPHYVCNKLGGKKFFSQFYHGTFKKSFRSLSRILNGVKFVVDLSLIPNDGGGTQYTFLEAIYHDAALIINRNWVENIPQKLCEFRENYNCYAVSNAVELAELIRKGNNLDTAKIVRNSKKLMHRHIHADWTRA